MSYIAVVDYGAGNLMSVCNALKFIGAETVIARESQQLKEASGVILPGVGAFPAAMKQLYSSGLVETIKDCAKQKPLLGICLGMQMLFDSSCEVEYAEGLSLLPGNIVRIEGAPKLPHIGWNDLHMLRTCALTENVADGSYVYFVHSFRAEAGNAADVAADTVYGENIPAIVNKGTIFGCQFHPEKSGEPGLQMLRNFCKLC